MDRLYKKRIFSGIKPSGDLHLGNYVGAISQWVKLQDEYDCVYSVVDYHAITVKQDPKLLKKRIIDIARIYLAFGINPKKSIIFQQSDVREHAELAWILNCVARVADLNKMTQYKDKFKKEGETVGVGLYDYPVLMAADILLYNTDVVPVGEDQVQHVELTRELAKRFNQQFEKVFKIPEAIVNKEGARIMGLDDPAVKMSKSASSEYNWIALLDEPAKAAKKIMKAVTDSGSEIIFDREKKPAIANLLTIYSSLSGRTIKSLENNYAGKGYGDFKEDLAEAVIDFLTEFQYKYNNITETETRKILNDGAVKAGQIAAATLKRAKIKIGVN